MVIEGMTVYKLKVKQVPAYVGSSSIIKRFSFGEPSDIILTGGTCKTILLMGATGSGKTMWINALVNYVLGVEWDDSFRFMLIKEHLRGASQANSQTQGVTAYDLHYREGFRIPFSLTVIDTPGFGDTGGMERDEDISSAIQEFFNHENGIQVYATRLFLLTRKISFFKLYLKNLLVDFYGRNWTPLDSSFNPHSSV
jgi:GTP-binding protein EngB required for normal cell division